MELPAPFAIDVPLVSEDEGPIGGLTLDQAIEQLTRGSLALRAEYLEIPQARADELTASLRTNPFVFADGQLIPYRQYSATTNPGGPSQYDINITYPFDLSGKRQARMEVAAKRDARSRPNIKTRCAKSWTRFTRPISTPWRRARPCDLPKRAWSPSSRP